MGHITELHIVHYYVFTPHKKRKFIACFLLTGTGFSSRTPHPRHSSYTGGGLEQKAFLIRGIIQYGVKKKKKKEKKTKWGNPTIKIQFSISAKQTSIQSRSQPLNQARQAKLQNLSSKPQLSPKSVRAMRGHIHQDNCRWSRQLEAPSSPRMAYIQSSYAMCSAVW